MVLVAEAGEVEALLVDEQGVGLKDERLAAARDAFVGDAEAVFAQKRGDDVVHVLEPALVEMARLVHVEDLAVQIFGGGEVFSLEGGLELLEDVVEVLL